MQPEAASASLDAGVSGKEQKKQTGSVAVLIILLFALAGVFLGNVHIITGSHLDSPRIVKKESFGFSETFIKVDTITSMPWISAQSRYPLGCAVLQRENLIESNAEFRARKDKEMKREMERVLKDFPR